MDTIPTDGIISLFINADRMMKFVVCILLLFSIIIWALFLEKIIKLRSWGRNADSIESRLASGDTLMSIYNNINIRNDDDPMGALVLAGIQEWNEANDADKYLNQASKDGTKALVNNAMEVSMAISNIEASRNIYILQIITSIAPFVGLFGTVWGIMTSFRRMAESGTAIQSVASGLAEALFATALGIFVAIIANVLHSVICTIIEDIMIRMDIIKIQILAAVTKEFKKTK